MNKSVRVEISYKTILFTAIFLAAIALLWQIRGILTLFFICFIFMEATNSSVSRLEASFKIPRALAIALVYLLILTVVIIALGSIVPVLIEQTSGLIQALPHAIENFRLFGVSAIDLSAQFKILQDLPNQLARFTLSVFSNLFATFVVFFITFYLLLERKNFAKYSFSVFGKKGRDLTLKVVDNLEKRLGHWLNAQLLLMVIVGLLSYAGYFLLGLKYAVPLAIAAGFLEVVPNIGPTISAVLAGLIGLTVSPFTALLAIIWGTLVQQLENNFIVPKVMRQTVGLNPIVTIFLLIIGARLGGVMGAVLAIPIYLTIEVVTKALLSQKQKTR